MDPETRKITDANPFMMYCLTITPLSEKDCGCSWRKRLTSRWLAKRPMATSRCGKRNAFFSPPVAKRLMRPFQGKEGPGKTKAAFLTSRQKEILQLIAEGYANKQIADLLSLSIKTVEKHRQDLMNTLDIHNAATLTR